MSVIPIRSESSHEASGLVAGVASATVSKNNDPEGLGRVKLKLPWRDPSFETDWCRIAVPMAGKDRGSFFLPEVGDEVLVAFDRDDIRYPYVLGQLWSQTDRPPANDAAGKNDLRVIRSRKGHVIIFDDNRSKGRILIQLDDGKKIEIDDDGIVIDDTVNRIAMGRRGGGTISIEAGLELTLKAPRITIQGQTSVTIDGGASLVAKGGTVAIN